MATTIVKRDPILEEKIRMYGLLGLSAALPFALLTKDQRDDAAILRWQAALNDPAKFNGILDIVLGPK